MKYVCELCGSIYDEELGDARRGIPAGTVFADLPESYSCHCCGSEREAFAQWKPRKPMPLRKPASTEAWENAIYQDKDQSDR